LLIPFLGGYIFLSLCNLYKFKLIRDDSQRLIFKAGVFGLFFFSISYFLMDVLYKNFFGLSIFWDEIIPSINYLDTALFSLFISLISAFGYNYFRPSDLIKAKLIIRDDDPIELILLDALISEYLVLITLETNKVYVGLVTNNPFSIRDEVNSILILPYLSGYRDSGTKKIEFTTLYTEAYELLSGAEDENPINVEDFQIAIKYSQIISINRFDLDVYENGFLKGDQIINRLSNQLPSTISSTSFFQRVIRFLSELISR